MNFQPELGQLGFSKHDVPELAIAALNALGDEIERVMWNITQQPYHAQIHNSGTPPLETDTFTMRAYCWCDGHIHPDGCPPNFTWRDIQICWYKYLGRGTSCNKHLTPDLTAEMLTDCLTAIRKLDVDITNV